MVEVNLKDYAKLLIDNTQCDKFEWEQMGDSKYRLVMSKGSVVLEKSFIGSSTVYIVSFYSITALIFKATILMSNPLYNDYKDLHDTIISKNNERINSEIMDLFS